MKASSSSSSSSSSFPSSWSSSVASCRHQSNFHRDANNKCEGEDNDKDCTLLSAKPSSSIRKNENDDENREGRKSTISPPRILRREKSKSFKDYEEENEENKNSFSSAGPEPEFFEAAAEVAAAEIDVASPEAGSVQSSSVRNHHEKSCDDEFSDESPRERKGKILGRAAAAFVGGGCGDIGSGWVDSSSISSSSPCMPLLLQSTFGIIAGEGESNDRRRNLTFFPPITASAAAAAAAAAAADAAAGFGLRLRPSPTTASFPSSSSLAETAGSDSRSPWRAASSSSRLPSPSRVKGIGRDASKYPNSSYAAGFEAAAVDADTNRDAAAIAANYAATIRAVAVSAGTSGRTASASSPTTTMMSAAARAYWMQHNNPPPFFRDRQNLWAMEAEEVGTATLPFSVRHQQSQAPTHRTTPTTTTTTELATQLLLSHHCLHHHYFQRKQQQFQQRQQYFHRHRGIGQESAPSFSSPSSRHSPVPIRNPPARNLLRTSPTPPSPAAPPRSRTAPHTVAEAQEASATTAAAIAEMGYGRMASLVAAKGAIRRLMTWRIMTNRMAAAEVMAWGAALGERREIGGEGNGEEIENVMGVYAGGWEGERGGEGAGEGGGNRSDAVGVAVARTTTSPAFEPRINRPIATTMEAIGHCTEAASSEKFYNEGRGGGTASTTEGGKVLAEGEDTFSATSASSFNRHSIGNENLVVAATSLPPQPNAMAGTEVRHNRQEKEEAEIAAVAAAAAIRRYSQYHVNTTESATTRAPRAFGLSRKEKVKGGKCTNDGNVASKATQHDKQSPSMANCVPQDSDDGDGEFDSDSNEEEEVWSTTRATIEKTASSSRASRAVAEKNSADNIVSDAAAKAQSAEGEEGKKARKDEGLKDEGDVLDCVPYGARTEDGSGGSHRTVSSRESAGEEDSGGGVKCNVPPRKSPATNEGGGGGRGGGGGNDADDIDGDAADVTAPSALKRRLPRIARTNRKRRTQRRIGQGGEASDGGAGSGGGGASASLSFDPSYGIDRQFPHRLDKCDHLPEWSSKRHNCKLCYFRSGQEKKSHVMCTKCGVCLCFNQKRNCYMTWHSDRRIEADDDGSLSECRGREREKPERISGRK